jgi:hypothetical protein
MSTESRVRDRIRFQEVAKLAETTERPHGSDGEKKEDSGMIDLAAIAAGETGSQATADRGSASPQQAPARGARDANPPPPSGHPSSPPMSSSGVKTRQSLLSSSAIPGSTAAPRFAPGASSRQLPGASEPAMWSRAASGLPAAPESGIVASTTQSPETTRPTTHSTSVTAERARAKGPSTVWIALVGGVAVGALSAVIAFKMRESDASRSSIALASADRLPGVPATAPAADSTGWKTTTGRVGPDDHAVDMSTRPATPAATAAHAIPPGTPAAPAAPPVRTAEPPQGAAVAAATPPPAPTNPNSLEAMMKRAVRAESPQAPAVPPPAAAPAAAPTVAPATNLPLKPAMGAVMGALGAVMPTARYCLGPDDPVSRATITFKSDGSVESVAIAGDAAGQPAEACIRARLMDARIPPFANPKFTWTVPVRPAN